MSRPHHRLRGPGRALRAALVALGLLPGCSDSSTIGGLCTSACTGATGASPSSLAAGDACEPAECRPDGGTEPDAGACPDGDCDALDAGKDAGNDAGNVCVPGTHPLERAEQAFLIAVDDAASLAPWWVPARAGLVRFLERNADGGLAAGLTRFGDVCEPEPYSNPLVPIAPVGENLGALLAAIPDGALATTSTVPVLEGALRYARDWAQDRPGARVAVLLVTDGSPGACDALTGSYDAEAMRIAQEARTGSPPVPTYVLSLGVMHTPALIAAAGGTQAEVLDIVTDEAAALAALERIRGDAQRCVYGWPGDLFPTAPVEVVSTGADGSERRYAVHRDASCERAGFYLDGSDPDDPVLRACPVTCAELDPIGQVALDNPCSDP